MFIFTTDEFPFIFIFKFLGEIKSWGLELKVTKTTTSPGLPHLTIFLGFQLLFKVCCLHVLVIFQGDLQVGCGRRTSHCT
jgi:hypothetical protein